MRRLCKTGLGRLGRLGLTGLAALVVGMLGGEAQAWLSSDENLEIHGAIDSTTHQRAHGDGLSKQRFRAQIEFSHQLPNMGPFVGVSLSGILRGTYDSIYDLNDDDYGELAGASVFGASSGIPNGTFDGLRTPWGFSPVSGGIPLLPGGSDFGFNATDPSAPFFNPNVGLRRVGSELGSGNTDRFGGGLEFFTPVRPCDVDPRGCIEGYMDFDEDDLRFPEFRDEMRWLRELYIDATLPLNNGDEINFRIGRQQIVWGRTDLFRVLDQVNPIDFSIQNIYEEFEDSRIPLGILSAEWRLGAIGIFEDLNYQFIWNFEEFTPMGLGQGGEAYSILQAGDLFRSLKNCWDNGCTISNFATGLSPFGNLSTDFPRHTVGIRDAHLPTGRDQFGFRMEGVFKSIGFSFNGLTYYSQLPSLRAGIPSRNPFVGDNIPPAACPPGPPGPGNLCLLPFNPFDPTDVPGLERPRPFVPAFDIHFPRIWLGGASADYYWDFIKSTFRVEFAYTVGEEFADTSKVRLFSDSDVARWVVGWDRPTYIRFLNPNRTFLLSGQVFGQHLLDYRRIEGPTGHKIGFADWEHNWIVTFLFQGFYMNDRLQPRLIQAYDFKAGAYVVGPAIDWLINDNWRVTLGANLKFGRGRNAVDDGRTSNSLPPFTAGPACATGAEPACFPGGGEFSSVGQRLGFEPLGRFRSGPIGMAQHEDELQLLLRYQF